MRKIIYRSIGGLLAIGIVWTLIGGFGTVSNENLAVLVVLLILMVV